MEYCNNYDFINYLLDEKIYDLLNSIHQHYPNLFKKNYVIKELKVIIKNIKLFTLDNKTIVNKHIKNIHNKKGIKNDRILVNKKKNINLYKKNATTLKLKENCKLIKNDKLIAERTNIITENNNIITESNNIITSKYDNTDRCQGRVWGDTIINNKSINYGNQCKNKKSKNSDYCFIHQNKLSHGNYFTKPNIMIKSHFEKNSKKIIIK